jgi:DNA-binding MarR family transcriptional regulator
VSLRTAALTIILFQMKRMSSVARAASEDEAPFLLEHFLPYELSVTANRVSRLFARRYADAFGLSIPEWRCMAVIGRYALVSATAIAERTAMDKVKVSRAVAALRAKGLVRRSPHPADRRLSLLAFTAKGRRIYEQIVPLARRTEAELMQALGPADRAALSAMLGRIAARALALDARTLDQGAPD